MKTEGHAATEDVASQATTMTTHPIGVVLLGASGVQAHVVNAHACRAGPIGDDKPSQTPWLSVQSSPRYRLVSSAPSEPAPSCDYALCPPEGETPESAEAGAADLEFPLTGYLARAGDPVPMVIGTQFVTAADLVAQRIAHALAGLDGVLGELFIVHPPSLGAAGRRAIEVALTAACGPCPTVAWIPRGEASLSGLAEQHEGGTKLALLHVGGSTSEASVWDVSGSVPSMQILRADTDLGGDAIDDALLRYVCNPIRFEPPVEPTGQELRNLVALHESCREAKETLSREISTAVSSPLLGEKPIRLVRRELDEICAPFVAEVVALLREVLDGHEDVTTVLLDGGFTSNPQLIQGISGATGLTVTPSRSPAVAAKAIVGSVLKSRAVPCVAASEDVTTANVDRSVAKVEPVDGGSIEALTSSSGDAKVFRLPRWTIAAVGAAAVLVLAIPGAAGIREALTTLLEDPAPALAASDLAQADTTEDWEAETGKVAAIVMRVAADALAGAPRSTLNVLTLPETQGSIAEGAPAVDRTVPALTDTSSSTSVQTVVQTTTLPGQTVISNVTILTDRGTSPGPRTTTPRPTSEQSTFSSTLPSTQATTTSTTTNPPAESDDAELADGEANAGPVPEPPRSPENAD